MGNNSSKTASKRPANPSISFSLVRTAIITYWFRESNPFQIISNPLSKDLISIILTYSKQVFKSQWSEIYKGNDILLSNNNQKATKQVSYGSQTVRLKDLLIKNTICKITFIFNYEGYYDDHFVGIIPNIKDDKHLNDPSSYNIGKYFISTFTAYGFDNEIGYIYNKKGRVLGNNNWKPQFNSGDKICIEYNFMDLSFKYLVLYVNGKKFVEKDKEYSIIVDSEINEWYPAVTLWNQKTACQVEFGN